MYVRGELHHVYHQNNIHTAFSLVLVVFALLKSPSILAFGNLKNPQPSFSFPFSCFFAEELFPIFAAAPETQGGLHFDSPTLGTMNGIGGATTIVYTLFVYPTLGRMFGSLLCMRVAILVAIPLYLAIPACSLIFPHGALFWSILKSLFVLKSVVLATAFTAMMVLVCNASTPDTLGAVNGLGQSTSMLFRTFAPALGGTLWTMSITTLIPAHQFLSWLALVAATIATFGIAMCLRAELDEPRVSNSYS